MYEMYTKHNYLRSDTPTGKQTYQQHHNSWYSYKSPRFHCS